MPHPSASLPGPARSDAAPPATRPARPARSSARPLRVAVVHDYALVTAGLTAVLEPFADRVVVVEPDSRRPVSSEVDLVLDDPFARRQDVDRDPDSLMDDRFDRPPMVVFSWNTQPALVEAALAAGAAGYVSKGLDGRQLVLALERIVAGETVAPTTGAGTERDACPGARHGLSAREAEVLALLCQGLSNREIAERAFIGLNTVKTHLRVLFQKIGVDSRIRAVLWGVDHAFRPDLLTSIDGAGSPPRGPTETPGGDPGTPGRRPRPG